MGIRTRIGRGSRGTHGAPLTVGSRLIGTFFFGAFLAAGLFFTYLTLQEAMKTLDTWGWDAVPARIVQSEFVVDDTGENPYRFKVLFEYDAAGNNFRADTATVDGEGWTDDFHDVQRLLTDFPVGAQVTAYAHPQQPGPAVLVRGSAWMLALLPLPLIFVLIGAVGVYAMWSRKPSPDMSDTAISNQPVAARGLGQHGLLLFFGLFAVVGGTLTWFLGVGPLLRGWQASTWAATPAAVERSDLLTFSDSDGTTYRLDILYRYTVDSQTYRSNAYDFIPGASSGRSRKQGILQQYPVGSETVCYVDPDDPTVAVLNPKPSLTMLFGLIPAVFLLVGVGGLIATARSKRGPHTALFPAAAREPNGGAPAGAFTLTSSGGRWTKCIALTCVALFWTGISGAMWVMCYRDGEWFGFAFLTLFVLIGMGLCFGAAFQFLALFNPQVRLTLPSQRVTLGETFTIEWELVGNISRLQDFALKLEGQERATYRQGTDTHTDSHTFLTLTPLLLTDLARIMDGRGRIDVSLPANTMHTFKARHNEVRWVLKAIGKIRRWPDVNDEWTIDVAPLAPRTAGPAAAVAEGESE